MRQVLIYSRNACTVEVSKSYCVSAFLVVLGWGDSTVQVHDDSKGVSLLEKEKPNK